MKDRNHLVYFATVIVIIIVYLVIYLFGVTIKRNIYAEGSGYEHNIPSQPVNNILSIHPENNNDDKNDKSILFRYESDDENYIELYNQFPTADEVGRAFSGNKYTQDFRLKLNPHAVGIIYTITLKKQAGTNMEDDWAKTYLEADGIGVPTSFRINGRVKTFNEYPNYFSNPEEKVIYQGIVTYAEAKRGYKDFTLRMWVSEDIKLYNENYYGKSFKTRVTVYAIR